MGDASAAEEAGQFGDAGSSRTVKATPKAMPKAAVKPAAKPAPKLIDPSNIRSGRRSDEESQVAPADKTKMSVADRAKASRESARAGSGPTDKRSVGERLRSALAGKDRGGNSVDFAGSGMGMKRGGSVNPSKMGGVKTAKPSFGSASSRADGIASKGKTRGKYI
jgi:hypothetical protein